MKSKLLGCLGPGSRQRAGSPCLPIRNASTPTTQLYDRVPRKTPRRGRANSSPGQRSGWRALTPFCLLLSGSRFPSEMHATKFGIVAYSQENDRGSIRCIDVLFQKAAVYVLNFSGRVLIEADVPSEPAALTAARIRAFGIEAGRRIVIQTPNRET
jgi:hypothetical protein